jgi:hypothetical protein
VRWESARELLDREALAGDEHVEVLGLLSQCVRIAGPRSTFHARSPNSGVQGAP